MKLFCGAESETPGLALVARSHFFLWQRGVTGWAEVPEVACPWRGPLSLEQCALGLSPGATVGPWQGPRSKAAPHPGCLYNASMLFLNIAIKLLCAKGYLKNTLQPGKLTVSEGDSLSEVT